MKKEITLYQAFGLIIGSELLLPALPPAQDRDAKPDINICFGHVNTQGSKSASKDEGWFIASPMQFRMHMPEIAWFMVSDGNSIVIAPESEAEEQGIRLFLLGSCMGAILQQRQMLVIHGNCIRFGDRGVIFAGPSGIGKSTLAGAFHQRGFEVMADDVCAIDAGGLVVASFPQLKLWQDAATKLQIDTSNLDTIRLEDEKYAFPLQQAVHNALPVAAVYILGLNDGNECRREAIESMDKFIALADNTYRMEFLHGLGLQAAHLRQCAALAGKIKMARISRPDHGDSLDKLVDFILADLRSKAIAVS